ncbi:MAG: ABC transporter ATP-binding protein [Armatimonadota bacterium]
MSDSGFLLELSGVTRSYGASGGTPEQPVQPVLKGVDLRLTPGEAVAIVGPSGSGKSTLLHIIATLERPDSGSVLLGGRELTTLVEADLAPIRSREIGMIFQFHYLLPQCTVLENVLIPTLAGGHGARGESPETRARRLLERVGLSHRLGHRPGQLSGGERQRAAVVRALINQPKLLLADEPTGALDQAASDNLADLLLEIHREENAALIVITHSRELAARMGRVLELQDGRLMSEAAVGAPS